jgi:hypothetical protein
MMQAATGIELYSTSDAKLNLALELRYLFGDAELTETLDGTPRTSERSLDLWLTRANITWHF